MDKLPYIEDLNLYWAVNYAVYLIENNIPLKHALFYTVKHKNYSIKAHIERLVRQAYPKDFFINRARKVFLSKMTRQELSQWIGRKRQDKRLEEEFRNICNEA